MKKIKVIPALVIMLILSCVTANAMTLEYDNETHEYTGSVYALIVNNELIDPPLAPIIFNDHALVPVREIFEELGADVSYDMETQTVSVEKDDYFIELRINEDTAYVNSRKVKIPDGVAPKLIAEAGGETKTMVPVRFIGESIGLDVDFNAEFGAVLVESEDYEFESGWHYEYTSHAKNVIYEVTSEREASNRLRLTLHASKPLGETKDFLMSDPNRIVLDIYGAVYRNVDDYVNTSLYGINAVRLGDNETRARIVVDYSEIERYSVEKVSDTEIALIIEAKDYVSTVTPDTSKLIVLDAGHGGSDSGAVGDFYGTPVLEKELTLQITYKVKERLEERGYRVSMTRTGDTLPSLKERPEQANAENAAVFVSIHINSVDNVPTANGTEVYYAESNNGNAYGANSRTLATNILERMLKYTGATNRGVKTAEHAVTKRSNMPAALAEVGFITNEAELTNMMIGEYQYKVAQGIAEGIMITLENITVPQQ